MVAQAQANGTLPGQTGQGPQTQQQPQVGPNGQAVNPGQVPNGNSPNVSIDITSDGKIVSRNFRLVGGVGQEEVTDTCHYLKFDTTDLHDDAADPTLNSKQVSRFLYPQYDRFEMFFDPQGNLSIAAQSVNGQASSRSAPIPYTLNQGDQTIEVGAFSIAGPASTQFVQAEKAVAQQFGNNEDAIAKELYEIQGGTSPGPNSGAGNNHNGGNPGFVLGPQASTNNPGNGGYTSMPQNPILQTPASTALSIPGFTGKISTWFYQPQHVTEILVPEVPFQSKTFAQAQPDNCVGNGHGRYVNIHLQPTQ